MFLKKNANIKIALMYPGNYESSITNLATHIAYYMLNTYKDVLVDRFTLNNVTSSAIYSLNLRNFDLALVTLSYELDYVNALKMIINNGIKLTSDSERRPIFIAGGPAVTANPLPVSKFFDAILLGEGEEFFRKLIDLTTLLDSRKRFLESLSSLGAYVPSLYQGEKIKKQYIPCLDDAYYPVHQIQSMIKEPIFGKGYIMEVSRGCPHLCSFCMEAFISYPYRFRSYDKVIEYVSKGLKVNRVDRVIFYSLSFFDYPYAEKLLEELIAMRVRYSIPSLRADTLDEYRVSLISMGGQKTLTLAPETNSPRMKCIIRKHIDDSTLVRVINEGLKLGLDVKLYYLIGIPQESLSDVRESIKFLINLKASLDRYGRKVRVTVNPLIPKANTPMQYFPLISREEYLIKLKLFRSELPRKYFEIDALNYNVAYVQALLSLGDEKLSELLAAWAIDNLSLSSIKSLAKKLKLDDVMYRRREPSDNLPWDFIDLGLNLKSIYNLMMKCI